MSKHARKGRADDGGGGPASASKAGQKARPPAPLPPACSGPFEIIMAVVVISGMFMIVADTFFAVHYPVPHPGASAVVVTGAASGIGRDAALTLAAEGFLVFAGVRRVSGMASLEAAGAAAVRDATQRRQQEAREGANAYLRHFSGLVGEHGSLAQGSIVPVLMDIDDAAQVEAAVATVSEALEAAAAAPGMAVANSSGSGSSSSIIGGGGRRCLAGLINNAGGGAIGPLETTPFEVLARTVDTNVLGTLRVTRAFLPLLRECAEATGPPTDAPARSGVVATGAARIVNIGSVAGMLVSPFSGTYSVSRFGGEALADGLRRELSAWPALSVSLLEAGAIDTPGPAKARRHRERVFSAPGGEDKDGSRAERTLYGEALMAFAHAEEAVREVALPVGATTDAILHSLCSPKPRTRYMVSDRPSGLGAWVLGRLLPDRIADAIFGEALGMHARAVRAEGWRPRPYPA